MNVLFIFSDKDSVLVGGPLGGHIHLHLGISLIASLLKRHGHNTDLVVLSGLNRKRFLDKYIKEFQPELICFTAVFSEYEFIAETAEYIKLRYPDIYLLMGGPHVTLNPERAIGDGFDAVCIGEGEYPTLELVEQLDSGQRPTQIRNLWIKDGEKIEKNPTRDFIEDLDSLPFPERGMWDKWIQGALTEHSILLGRGCPFQCTYCCNHALRKVADGRYVRFRSVDNIVEEVRAMIKEYPEPKSFYLEVETIGINFKFALELFSRLEQFNKGRSEPVSFGINLRITENVDYGNLFRAMKDANFSYVKIGLESGSERVRREILNRNYSNNDYLRVVQLAKDCGLKVDTYVMIGVPGERLADFKETVECVRRGQPRVSDLSIFFPYPGTVLYQYCKDNNLLPKKINKQLERRKVVLNLPGFSKRQIQRQSDWFYYNVYKGYRPLKDLLKMTKRRKARSSYLLSAVEESIRSFIRFLHRVKRIFIKGGIFRQSPK